MTPWRIALLATVAFGVAIAILWLAFPPANP